MSLFTRLVGTGGEKIALHLFHSLIDEVNQGTRINGNQASDIMNLTASEKAHAVTIIGKLTTVEQYRRFFDYLCLGELDVTSPHDYTDESLFWIALDKF